MATHDIFLGTYTKQGSEGIYSTQLDLATGQLSVPVLAAPAHNPTFLALDPRRKWLFAVSESVAQASAFNVSSQPLRLNQIGTELPKVGPAPCYISVDATGKTVFLTNYHNGFVAALPIRPDGSIASAQVIVHRGNSIHPERQQEPHPHSAVVAPDNRHVIVCDLGLDKIFSYALDAGRSSLVPDAPFTRSELGAGPRHSAFSPDGRHLYVVNEINSTLAAFDYRAADGALKPIATWSTLPLDFTQKSTAAEVRVHRSGRFVYSSNRGHDSIAIFARDPATGGLTFVRHVPCGGQGPRNFALSPDCAWLVCANQDTNSVSAFCVTEDGANLSPTGSTVTVSQPVCVLFYS